VVSEAYRQPLRRFRRPVSSYLTAFFAALLVGLLFVWLIINFVKTPSEFMTVFFIGLTNGAVYALVALGYTLVYGILELINFAHGDVFMLGGMISATFLIDVFALGDNPSIGSLVPAMLVALFVSMIICGVLNASIERIAYKPLRSAPRLAPLITAIGMSFILQDVGLAWKGPGYINLPTVLPTGEVFSVGGVVYTWNKLIVVIITIPVLFLLLWLYVMYFTQIRFDQGFQLGLIAFTAAVLGGIGNLLGAVVGALVIGFIQAFNEGLGWHAPGSDWTTSIVFSILILILVFRPEGLLGERTPEGG
jgi:branched-chain amino acid transport system permease protein